MASTFHGPVSGHAVVAAPHCESGGTMNFHLGPTPASGALNSTVLCDVADSLQRSHASASPSRPSLFGEMTTSSSVTASTRCAGYAQAQQVAPRLWASEVPGTCRDA